MYKLCVFLLIALLANGIFGMNFRSKRQANVTSTTVSAQTSTAQARLVTPSTGGSSTTQKPQAETDACIRNCPVTAEYNPVCGSNGMTYSNPGRLLCAQACGVNVRQLKTSPCF